MKIYLLATTKQSIKFSFKIIQTDHHLAYYKIYFLGHRGEAWEVRRIWGNQSDRRGAESISEKERAWILVSWE